MADVVRTFVAVEIPAEVKARGAEAHRRSCRQPIGQGEMGRARAHALDAQVFGRRRHARDARRSAQAVARAVEPLRAFRRRSAAARGPFPMSSGRARCGSAWAKGPRRWSSCTMRIDRELATLGYREENRRFRPHLTIGRVRQSPGRHRRAGAADPGERRLRERPVDRLRGRRSSPASYGREGPTYEPLGHAELKGR